MNTGQTVYEQLQEIYEKIADKTLSLGCKIIRINGIEETVVKFVAKGDGTFYLVTLCSSNNTHYGVSLSLSDVENIIIIGHPISLSRVLSVLGKYWSIKRHTGYGEWEGSITIRETLGNGINHKQFQRKLLNEDGSDAMLDDQDDHTIEALHKLLVRK